jgi:hypothetical protein
VLTQTVPVKKTEVASTKPVASTHGAGSSRHAANADDRFYQSRVVINTAVRNKTQKTTDGVSYADVTEGSASRYMKVHKSRGPAVQPDTAKDRRQTDRAAAERERHEWDKLEKKREEERRELEIRHRDDRKERDARDRAERSQHERNRTSAAAASTDPVHQLPFIPNSGMLT